MGDSYQNYGYNYVQSIIPKVRASLQVKDSQKIIVINIATFPTELKFQFPIPKAENIVAACTKKQTRTGNAFLYFRSEFQKNTPREMNNDDISTLAGRAWKNCDYGVTEEFIKLENDVKIAFSKKRMCIKEWSPNRPKLKTRGSRYAQRSKKKNQNEMMVQKDDEAFSLLDQGQNSFQSEILSVPSPDSNVLTLEDKLDHNFRRSDLSERTGVSNTLDEVIFETSNTVMAENQTNFESSENILDLFELAEPFHYDTEIFHDSYYTSFEEMLPSHSNLALNENYFPPPEF
ncbi:hypothetical protein G9A89_002586 [Geosiphon pyriformis]|nr:hypothetical protein G9A89_002586 [Geosiphon pyriformis]